MRNASGMEVPARPVSGSSWNALGSVRSGRTGWEWVVYIIAIRVGIWPIILFFHRRLPVSPLFGTRLRRISLRRVWSRVILALDLVVPYKTIIYACRNSGRATTLTLADPPPPIVPIATFQRSLIVFTHILLRPLVVSIRWCMFILQISCSLTMVGPRTIIRTVFF
jgi:hypothetical protein